MNKFTGKKFYDINSVSNRYVFGENFTNNEHKFSNFCLNLRKKSFNGLGLAPP
jgi:hypothetical protein